MLFGEGDENSDRLFSSCYIYIALIIWEFISRWCDNKKRKVIQAITGMEI
ncbi:hypothetical protein HanHA300_Chr02g0062111 [Helianthus annuus]|nr:hypothetical protein HanHA300_Chr02g0062111 [Helianthus annuus]KAJ0619370.1 hypothetical protein HanHA89_Chr02g0070631 [Helianthus annuus]